MEFSGDRIVLDTSMGPGLVKIFEARGLTKVYDMGEVQVRALDAVDFDLMRGEMLVLLGASGSGKSTLLNILGGLDVPTSGTVRFLDIDLTHADDAQLTRYRRNHVGFVFQFYNLIPSLTARENVALVTDIARDPLSPADALDLVGLGGRMDHFPAQLSGGEQQRARSPNNRTSCCATSRPGRSTRRPAVSYSRFWSASTGRRVPPRQSSRTMRRLRPWPTGSSASTMERSWRTTGTRSGCPRP
jgi:hypothetical protein